MYTFYYNQGSECRLPFAKAVADILGVKPKYTGVPKCAYIIDFATVTKDGNIEVAEGADDAKLLNLVQKLMERGYMTEQITQREEEPEEEDTQSVDEIDTPEEGADAPEKGTTISVPRDVFTNLGLDNLQKLLAAKDELIRMALGISSTAIELTDTAVNFPWFGELGPDEVRYVSQFISGLCELANTSKRITSKCRRLDNPKFAMRTWAIRLGFGGDEYRDLRKYLCKRLPGDAAWRYGKPEKEMGVKIEVSVI